MAEDTGQAGSAGAASDEQVDIVAQKDAEIAKLTEERDNYRTIALKRKGKLPGDADFFEGADKETGLTVEEQVKKTLLDEEIARKQREKDQEIARITKENSELRLALNNRPGQSVGGEGTSEGPEVKDNVLSEAQIAALQARAKQLGADPEKFIANFKENLLKQRR